mgnify:CR=1 FL=1
MKTKIFEIKRAMRCTDAIKCSDNIIENVNQFNRSISIYKKYLDDDNIFIFGIKPISPSSEYGYFLSKKISKKINKVTKFIEKPNKFKVKIIIRKKGDRKSVV